MTTNNLDLTVIIPVHSVADTEFNKLFTLALDSIQTNATQPDEVLIVRCGCDEVRTTLDNFDFSKYTFNHRIIENPNEKDFQNQINFAANNVNTTYFSFVEFDDEVAINWFSNVKKYITAYPDVNMFLPIISDVIDDNQFVGFTNEAAWAFNFSDTLGFIDHEVLLEFPNINPDGMVIKTETFKAIGGYKPSMKFTFNYEFLLRFTKDGDKIMVIPKIGYRHYNMRENSLFWQYRNSEDPSIKVMPDEAMFWMDAAKKEFHFKDDRNIIYGVNVEA